MGSRTTGYLAGVGLCLALALFGKELAGWPLLSYVGPMVLAILLGIAWATWAEPRLNISQEAASGLLAGKAFASKNLLRAGIILLGVRLDLGALAEAGVRLIGTELVLVALTLVIGYWLARKFGVDRKLAIIAAAGTAICGAAAAAAIAAQVKARSEQTVLGVATVAVLGTLFTVVDTLLYTNFASALGLTPQAYGAYAGATLHEIAHVIAAASPYGSDVLDTALLVKLARVILLVPAALVIGWWFTREERKTRTEKESAAPARGPLPIPWFVVWFLLVGLLHTYGVIPAGWSPNLIQISIFLMTMGMAGLGLQVNVRALRGGARVGQAALVLSVLLSLVGLVVARFLVL